MISLSYRLLTSLNISKTPSTVRYLSARAKEIRIDRGDDNSAYVIKLNNVAIKTPAKNLLTVKDESLAHAIANEWKANLSKAKPDLSRMHLTTLAYTALDNPFDENSETMANSIIEYLKFDTTRYRDVDEEELLKLQTRHWDPIVGWFEHTFGCHLPIDYGNITTPTSIPKSTEDIVIRHLQSHDRWPLVGLKFATENLKSLVLALSLTKQFLLVEQAVHLARLEVNYQTQRWSKVEWEHDLDEHCTNSRVAAGALFYHLTLC